MITRSSPRGFSEYLRPFRIVDIPSFPPVTGADNPDLAFSIGEANRHDSVTDFAHAEIPSFDLTMGNVLRNDAMGVAKAYCARAKETPSRIPLWDAESNTSIHIVIWLDE